MTTGDTSKEPSSGGNGGRDCARFIPTQIPVSLVIDGPERGNVLRAAAREAGMLLQQKLEQRLGRILFVSTLKSLPSLGSIELRMGRVALELIDSTTLECRVQLRLLDKRDGTGLAGETAE